MRITLSRTDVRPSQTVRTDAVAKLERWPLVDSGFGIWVG